MSSRAVWRCVYDSRSSYMLDVYSLYRSGKNITGALVIKVSSYEKKKDKKGGVAREENYKYAAYCRSWDSLTLLYNTVYIT